MSKVLNGRLSSKLLKDKLATTCLCLEAQGEVPVLGIIQGGDRPDSNQYIRNKIKASKEIGVDPIHYKVEFTGNVAKYIADISECIKKANKECHGIILQKPVPHIDKVCEDMLTELIYPEKDVDCLGSTAKAMFYTNRDNSYLPCTPAGIIQILSDNDIAIKGKTCCIIGRSDVVGRPLALGLLNENATPIICHSATPTPDLANAIKISDVIIVAVGVSDFINKDDFWHIDFSSKVIVDVGINYKDGKWFGDVSQDVKNESYAHTPVPGGVGPMTIAMLLDKVVSRVSVG